MESRSKGEGFSSCRERRNEERQYHLDENREIWVCMIGYVCKASLFINACTRRYHFVTTSFVIFVNGMNES